MSVPANQISEEYFEGGVPAALPLALLESVRAHDHPEEILQDEDVTVSLPRRLGLSGVVENQIQRYQSTRRAGRTVSLNEVFALVRLVLRRPDADLILRETGQRIAEQNYARVPAFVARLYRSLPLRVALLGTFRRVRRAFRELHVGDDVAIQRQPLAVRVRGSNTARLDSTGTACGLYTAALEQYIRLFTGRGWNVRHVQCETRGDGECAWWAEPADHIGVAASTADPAA